MWELEHDPEQTALTILMLRGYARAKQELEAAMKSGRKAERVPMIDLVMEIQAELMDEDEPKDEPKDE